MDWILEQEGNTRLYESESNSVYVLGLPIGRSNLIDLNVPAAPKPIPALDHVTNLLSADNVSLALVAALAQPAMSPQDMSLLQVDEEMIQAAQPLLMLKEMLKEMPQQDNSINPADQGPTNTEDVLNAVEEPASNNVTNAMEEEEELPQERLDLWNKHFAPPQGAPAIQVPKAPIYSHIVEEETEDEDISVVGETNAMVIEAAEHQSTPPAPTEQVTDTSPPTQLAPSPTIHYIRKRKGKAPIVDTEVDANKCKEDMLLQAKKKQSKIVSSKGTKKQ